MRVAAGDQPKILVSRGILAVRRQRRRLPPGASSVRCVAQSRNLYASPKLGSGEAALTIFFVVLAHRAFQLSQ